MTASLETSLAMLPPAQPNYTTGSIATTMLPPLWKYPRNDSGFAEAIADYLGEEIAYCPQSETWFTLSDARWLPDSCGRHIALVKGIASEALKMAATIADDAERSAAVSRALMCGNSHAIKKAVEMVAVDSRLQVAAESIDGDPWLLGVENGTLDLHTSTLITPPRETFVTRFAGTRFDAEAQCPLWSGFIDRVTAGHAGLAEFLQRSVGYSLTGLTVEHSFWFLHGCGKNGKSVFIETLQALAGAYGSRASERLLSIPRHGGESRLDETATLPGVRLLFGNETQEGVRLNERLVKDLTGGDTIRAQALYKQGFNFRPVCKLWMFGNHKPEISGTDYGIWRRVLLVPFTAQISAEEQDKNLALKLRDELPGILNWALAGLRAWERVGLNPPSCVTDGTAEYQSDQDLIADFLDECIEQDPKASTSKAQVFHAYQRWCEDNGIRHPLTSKSLSRRLKDRGHNELPGRKWDGCRIKDEEPFRFTV